MGNSATATLFYGYVFNVDNTWPWENEDEYDKYESFRERDWETRDFYIHLVLGKSEAEVDEMGWEEKSEIEKSIPVTVDTWGYLDGQGCYLVAPKDDRAVHNCSWDGPHTVDPAKLEPDPEWDAVLVEFANGMGVYLKNQKPAWHIVCSYG